MVQGATQVAGALPGAAAHVQGAAAGDLVRAVLRDRRVARLRARLLDPDDLAAADRLGRARAPPRATGAHALREYMRDYNHWTVLGVLCELLPQAENRVTLAGETDQYGMPVATLQLLPLRQRPARTSRTRRR